MAFTSTYSSAFSSAFSPSFGDGGIRVMYDAPEGLYAYLDPSGFNYYQTGSTTDRFMYPPFWLLATGSWDDTKAWMDNEYWID